MTSAAQDDPVESVAPSRSNVPNTSVSNDNEIDAPLRVKSSPAKRPLVMVEIPKRAPAQASSWNNGVKTAIRTSLGTTRAPPMVTWTVVNPPKGLSNTSPSMELQDLDQPGSGSALSGMPTEKDAEDPSPLMAGGGQPAEDPPAVNAAVLALNSLHAVAFPSSTSQNLNQGSSMLLSGQVESSQQSLGDRHELAPTTLSGEQGRDAPMGPEASGAASSVAVVVDFPHKSSSAIHNVEVRAGQREGSSRSTPEYVPADAVSEHMEQSDPSRILNASLASNVDQVPPRSQLPYAGPSEDFRMIRHAQLQMRYYGPLTSKPPSVEDLRSFSGPSRCLICAEVGHLDQDCPALRCGICGERDKHFAPACPLNQKCKTCYEPGHTEDACPFKSAHRADDEIPCPLCHKLGHQEAWCDTIWRTYAPDPSEIRKVKYLNVSCFSCGSNKHYGMDCPLRSRRQTGRPQSTTFSRENACRYLKDGGLSLPPPPAIQPGPPVRKSIGQRKFSAANEPEEDYVEFFQPKVTKSADRGRPKRYPRSRGKGRTASAAASGRGASAPQPLPRRPNPPAKEHREPAVRTASSGRGSTLPRRPNLPPKEHRELEFRVGKRQRSPAADEGSRSTRPVFQGDGWSPPALEPPSFPRNGGGTRASSRGSAYLTYRPMPSSARNAWAQHSL
ncbi:MAG: hypothetical protein M1826_003616 [Phylliscum demangeonii]|nr:MAG: hypothetical protein M1826_003616 [Phylliscum demangeonii]